MTEYYRELLFGAEVQARQTAQGSRRAYASGEGAASGADRLTRNEAAFIAARDSFYLATNGNDGWPYLQHRGGPAGFVKVLSDQRLGFADFRGNRQYISLGNLDGNDRAALFFMDYPNRARLKLLGRIRAVDLSELPDLAADLALPGYRAHVERALIVDVEAFDWNCPQHITPRYTIDEYRPAVARLQARILELEAQLAASAPAASPTPGA